MFAIEFALEKICHHIRTLELVLSVSLIHSLENLLSRWGLRFQIRSDSKYAVDCLTDYRYKWQQNGWKTNEGINKSVLN